MTENTQVFPLNYCSVPIILSISIWTYIHLCSMGSDRKYSSISLGVLHHVYHIWLFDYDIKYSPSFLLVNVISIQSLSLFLWNNNHVFFICEELQVLPTSYCQNMTWYKNKGHSTYLLVQENMTYLRNKSHPTYSSVHKDIPGEFHFRHFSIPTYDVYYGQKENVRHIYIHTWWVRKVLFHSP